MALISPFLVRTLSERLASYGLSSAQQARVRELLARSLTLRADQKEAIPVLEGIAEAVPDRDVAASQLYAALSLRIRFRETDAFAYACDMADRAMADTPTYINVAAACRAILELIVDANRSAARTALIRIASSQRGYGAHLAHTYLGLEALSAGDDAEALERYKRSLRVEHRGVSGFMPDWNELADALAARGVDVELIRREAIFTSSE